MLHTEIQDLISKGLLEQAIQRMKAAADRLADKDLLNALIHLSGRFSSYQSDKLSGVISNSQAQLLFNQLTQSALFLLDQFPPDDDDDNPGSNPDAPVPGPTTVQNAGKIYNIDKIDKADFF